MTDLFSYEERERTGRNAGLIHPQDAPHAPQDGPQRPDAGAETPDGTGGRQTDAGGSPDIQGRCPACNGASLFLAEGGYITCRRLDCPNPDAASQIIGEVADARQHGAYTFCDQLVGHVNMATFAAKISEKRAAYADAIKARKKADELVDELAARDAAAIRDQSALTQIRLHIAAHRPRLQYADPILLRQIEAVLRQVGELEAAGGEGA